MMHDRRKSHRHGLRGLAKIKTSTGALPRDCLVTDISDGGVRIHTESLDVPDQFVLMFAEAGRPRECRVVWRLGHEIGAEFTDAREQNFAQRVVRAHGAS